VSILTGRTKTQFSCMYSSMTLLESTRFLHCSCPPPRGRHTVNFDQFTEVIYEIWVVKLSCFFFVFFFFRGYGDLNYSFCIFAKNCCNFLMRSLIALKFGTNKEHIKVNSGAEFGMKYPMCRDQ